MGGGGGGGSKHFMVLVLQLSGADSIGADPEIFERGSPAAAIYKILESGAKKSLKMAFECSFQLFSYKSFVNIPPKGGPGPQGPSPKSATGFLGDLIITRTQTPVKVIEESKEFHTVMKFAGLQPLGEGFC